MTGRCANPVCPRVTSRGRLACRASMGLLPDRLRMAVIVGVDGAVLDAITYWRDNQ